jgi:hypothetical protein
MTPQEKARDLYFNYYQQVADGSSPEHNAKQCALIAVDEILCQINNWGVVSVKRYWEQVKQELEKL